MIPLIERVIDKLRAVVQNTFPELEAAETWVEVTPTSQEAFGHYQCNSAMRLAKRLRKPPREIAQALQAALGADPLFEKLEVAGPGFLNMTLHRDFLSQELDAIVRDPRLGIPLPETPQRVLVEFSSPNIAKEMHVGHLRSTIIGDTLARLFEFLGHEVVRLNHVGDWGTAFGMLITYLQEDVRSLWDTQEVTLSQLMEWYRASKSRFDHDEAFKQRARQAVVALQGGDATALKIWQKICEISRRGFGEVYSLLDVHLEERGESYYNPLLSQIVADLEEKGLITVSEGAKCVFHEEAPIPLMVQKSDGGYNYDTTDMAAMWHRVFQEKADRIIIVTDSGQSLHFALIRKTCEKAGYLDPKKIRFDHVTFGVVLGSDGKRFRTRSGETERLVDLLYAAIQAARTLLENRISDMSPESLDKTAAILGIDAVKYADLCNNRISDYVFSYERMLRFEGNTALFLLYAYVRVAGIKRKIGDLDLAAVYLHSHILLEHPTEILLGLHLLRFAETLKAMERDLFPHYLTDYLYVLAQKFHAFFRDCRVEGVPEEARRLLLCEAVAHTLERGFTLLGMQPVDRM